MLQHKLKIISLSDAQWECSCGYSSVYTGEKTIKQIKNEYKKHKQAINKTKSMIN